MRVLFINGSPHEYGNTRLAIDEVAKTLDLSGIESDILWIGNSPIQGCIGCYKCAELKRCVFHDEIYEKALKMTSEADAIVLASPVYYAGPTGSLCALLDRLFYSVGRRSLAYKPGASIAVCRRGGAVTAFDRLNKYFEICNMPVVSSQYWNVVYGRTPGEAAGDAEGLQTMRTLGRNMAWMLNSIAGQPKPDTEPITPTNFIR